MGMFKINKEWLRYIGMLIFTCLLCLGVAGCSLLDKFSNWKDNKDGTEIVIPEDGAEKQSTNDVQNNTNDTNNLKRDSSALNDAKGMDISLYFGDGTGQVLQKEARTIPKVTGIAKAAITELIAGPSEVSGLISTIPDGTVLNGINIRDDGVCVVDFSDNLLYANTEGANSEFLTVYSIVNTLSQFESVDKVQILIDGKAVETLAGNINIKEPISALE